MELQNTGVITLNPPRWSSPDHDLSRTLIVSGVARSGTSMVARVLHGAGVFLGSHMDEVVFEDNDFSSLFEVPDLDMPAMTALLRGRDATHALWGFKRPHLHLQGAPVVELCRNPFVILTVRDPVAIAERNAISEQRDPAASLSHATEDLQQMLHFAETLTCPVLLISYEKAVHEPGRFVERLLEFCGIATSTAERERLRALVEPDRPAYIQQARRVFEGYVDRIEDGRLLGWACEIGQAQPVAVTLFRDADPVADVLAHDHRQDLEIQGFGTGRHGFAVELAGLGFTPETRVSMRIQGRSFVLKGSGLPVEALGGLGAVAEAAELAPWTANFGWPD